MTILTVNVGSSSIRFAAFTEERLPRRLAAEHSSARMDDLDTLLQKFLISHNIESNDIAAVAHRIVHGGANLTESCLLDDRVEAEIGRLSTLAPLHNSRALAGIAASRRLLRAAAQVAVFDTAFYAALPEVAATYALPKDLCRKHGIRRYGFHGMAHRAMWRRWIGLRPEYKSKGRVISMQLGSGSSVTAISDGQPRDTSMGFSPLEGLVMGTRSGDLDPAISIFLQRMEGLSLDKLERLLNEESGLLGISGTSADMKRLLEEENERARLAVNLYCYRARKYLGAYLAVLGGADAILFGGGIGEHSAQVRDNILSGMAWAGIALDSTNNLAAVGNEACISRLESKIEVWVVPVDEGAVMAQEALAVLAAGSR